MGDVAWLPLYDPPSQNPEFHIATPAQSITERSRDAAEQFSAPCVSSEFACPDIASVFYR